MRWTPGNLIIEDACRDTLFIGFFFLYISLSPQA
jgi:hypothetical protein